MRAFLPKAAGRWTVGILLAVGIALFFPKLLSLVRLAGIAAEHTAWGFHPGRLADAYFTAERLPRLGIGLAAVLATLAAIIGVPHLIVNGFELVRDLRRDGEGGDGAIARFVRRQNRVQHEYLDQLSLAEAENLRLERDFSAADTREAHEVVERIARADAGRFDGFWQRLGRGNWLGALWTRSGEEIRTFPRALFHFVFSFASFTRSAYAYTWIWNAWFALRTFFPLFHPFLAATVALRPEFFRVATSRVGIETRPSLANGGRRVFWRTFGLFLFRRTDYRRLRAVEAVVVEGETLLRESIAARVPDAAKAGFFRAETAFAAGVARWLERRAERGPEAAGDSIFLSALDLRKLAFADDPERLRLTPAESDALAAEAAAELPAGRSPPLFRTLVLRARRSVAASIDPRRSRPVRIIQTTRTQLRDPKAMARAVRSMLASNLVDKPMELFFILVCYAGIEDGFLKPLQTEMFGPNAWFHLSRYVFINGYIYGVVAGIFSDTWLKIQQDTMNDGEFNDAPVGEDARRSFGGWLFRMTFRNPGNTWWSSQKYTVLEYILPTLKATFVTALLVNLVTLGRFDLDAFLANFLVLVFLPFTGLSWKIEQGFELASAWVVRDVPLRLRPHPLVQAYAQRAIARRRIVFNVYYKIWENVTWNWLTTFMNMNTAVYGTRSFSRILFAGFTPTELVANPLRELAASARLPAPLAWLALRVDALFTHAYTDGTQLQPVAKTH